MKTLLIPMKGKQEEVTIICKRVVIRAYFLLACSILLPTAVALSQDFCKGNFDFDKDVDGSDGALFKQHFGRSTFMNPCPPDGPAPVPKTRQLTSYWLYDNGWFDNGLAWPNPRFTDNGNGTVTDKLTGLIWLKNANCQDVQAPNWNQALETAYNLHGQCSGQYDGICGLSDNSCIGDWRLPNIKELQSLIDFGQIGPALPSGNPFTNVQSLDYWTSTTDAYDSQRSWLVFMANGYLNLYNKTSAAYVWPVRGGHSQAPITYRFTINDDGTVTDNNTGLIWLRNANCLGAVDWYTATVAAARLADGSCGLSDGSTRLTWRLPTRQEWQAFRCPYEGDGPAFCNTIGTGLWTEGDPFFDVQDERYWSVSDEECDADYAWTLDSCRGTCLPDCCPKSEWSCGGVMMRTFFWPVRDSLP